MLGFAGLWDQGLEALGSPYVNGGGGVDLKKVLYHAIAGHVLLKIRIYFKCLVEC